MGSSISSALGGQTNGAQGGTAGLQQGSGFYTPDQVSQQTAFVNALQGQLQGVANGTGPNPALSQLQATTQQNVGSANAQLAANRNLNPALAAKMANQNQIAANQTAGNQAATLSAQQQLGAMGQAGNLALGQEGIQNQANLGAQQINAGVAQGNAKAAQGANSSIVGGILGGAGSALGLARGGVVHYADGTGSVGGPNLGIGGLDSSSGGPNLGLGSVAPADSGSLASTVLPASGPSSKVGKFLSGMGKSFGSQPSSGKDDGSDPIKSGVSSIVQMGAKFLPMLLNGGGKVPAMLSPGEKYLTPTEAREVAKDKEKVTAVGKKVPGKAKIPGDSLKNDVVPATLTEGGMVIPRSKMTDAKTAAAFVKAHFAKRGKLG